MNKQITLSIFTVIFLVAVNSTSVVTTGLPNKSRFVKDHFIVKMKDETTVPFALNVMSGGLTTLNDEEVIHAIGDNLRIKITVIKQLFQEDIRNLKKYRENNLGKYLKVYIEQYTDIPNLCENFQKNPRVEFAEPDFVGEAAGFSSVENMFKPNDEYFNRQWGLYNDGNTPTTGGKSGKPGADINALKGWEIEKGSDDVLVAILDSGVKLSHPELSGRIWINTKEIKNNIDDDNNGYEDDIYGWNFAYENSNVSDDGGHGTNIAGTIGANTNNSIGYAGVDHKCKLLICKDLDNENLGEYSWWSSALYYAANNGAKVINMSEGGYDYSKTLQTAVDYAYNSGCIIIASMMNKNNGDNYYPASFKNILAVGATDADDSRCREFTWGGGSNWGKHIAVVAPGNRIYGLDYKENDNFDVYWSGTSQSTAIVSGLASLLLGQNKSRTNPEIREIITSTAKDRVGDPREDKEGWDQYYGFGRIDMYEALSYGKSPTEKHENQKEEKNDSNNAGDRQAKAVEKEKSDDNSSSNKARRADR